MLSRRMARWLAGLLVTLGCSAFADAQFQLWSQPHLLNDSWIAPATPPTDPTDPAQMLQMNTVNNGSYPVGFDYIKPSDGSARGLNSLIFTDGTVTSGRLAGGATGSFGVTCGGTKAYSDLLIMVAIDADALPADFAFSLGRQGQALRTFDRVNDFGYVDATGDDAGRPGGYYSESDPTGSPLGYDFNQGLVTIVAFADDPLSPAEVQWFDYEFENSPGKAVFSLYAKVSGAAWIYHTNRDVQDHAAPRELLHTFEVVPEPITAGLLLTGALAILRKRRGD